MKFTPQAYCFSLIWPGPGAGISICSNVRTSGPPVLCTRTAATIVSLPNCSARASTRNARPAAYVPLGADHRGREAVSKRARIGLAPARDTQHGTADVGGGVREQEHHGSRGLLRLAGAAHRDHRSDAG